MKRRVPVILIVLGLCVLAAAKEKSLEELRARLAKAKLSDQPKIYTEIAEREMDGIYQLYQSGDTEKAQASVAELVDDCDKAVETSIRAHKHMKRVEIALRKISDRLSDISRGIEFEHRPPFKSAIDRIEQGRSKLLNAMFSE